MNFKRLRLRTFFCETLLEEVESSIIGRIQIIKKRGKLTLLVDGVVQSGGLMDEIWKRFLPRLGAKNVKSCLLLGVGGGSIVKLLTKKYPEIKIIGIEIDEAIIKVGAKYFGLGNFANFKVINDDAINFVQKSKDRFDLCIINLFIGSSIPVKSETGEFLENIRRILGKEGVAMINRFYLNNDKEKTDVFELKLKQTFSKVRGYNIFHNRVFICSG